jgi:trimeric autotransporter adhesin
MAKALLWWMCLVAIHTGASEHADSLSEDDWHGIRTAHSRTMYAIQSMETDKHEASNPSQRWRICFDELGFTVESIGGDWTWGLELSGPAQFSHAMANHLYRTRSAGVVEWFINDPRGLEQGWILTQPVDGLQLRVRGGLKHLVTREAVVFENQLNYSGLKAWDADGKAVSTWFEPSEGGFAVCYDDEGAKYPITIDPLAQNAYLKANNTGGSQSFGASLAISGDTVVVGAPGESVNATGVNGDQSDNTKFFSGSAYVFVRTAGVWSQQAYLKASNTDTDDAFGTSVAISGDTIAVGAFAEDSAATGINGVQTNNFSNGSNSGAVYVFFRTGTTWAQQAYIKASNTNSGDIFGVAVALSGDTLAVGAPQEDSNASGVGGNQADNSLNDAGAVYVYVRNAGVWSQQAYLKSSNPGGDDLLGAALDLSGDTMVVGAPGEASNATAVNGNQNNDSLPYAGAAYIFVRTAGVWSQQAYLKPANPRLESEFGFSVSVAADVAVVGAPFEDSSSTGVNSSSNESAENAGAAYVFSRVGNVWSRQAYLKASNTGAGDQFGRCVAVDGELVLVGATLEDSNAQGLDGDQSNNAFTESGAAYSFTRADGSWTQDSYIKASNTGTGDGFGLAIAIEGSTVIIGADDEQGGSTGVNGSQEPNAFFAAGAAYVFTVEPPFILRNLAHTNYRAPGGIDLFYAKPGVMAIDPDGDLMYDTALAGAGAARGKTQAVYSTLGGSAVTMALQKATPLVGTLGLPPAAVVSSILLPTANQPSLGFFQAIVSGKGVTASSNRVLFQHSGSAVMPVFRSGTQVSALNSDSLRTLHEVLQSHSLDRVAIPYTLVPRKAVTTPAPLPATTAANDSGLLVLDHSGMVLSADAREGGAVYGGGGTFGQFVPRASLGASASDLFQAKMIPTPVPPAKPKPVDALFVGAARYGLMQGDSLSAISPTAKVGVFLGLNGRSTTFVRASVTGVPVAENEVLLDGMGTVLQQKGSFLRPSTSLRMAKLIRYWPAGAGQVVMQVQLSGAAVNAGNNSAILLRQSNENYLTLARTGDVPPGYGSSVKISKISAVEVEPENGHYAILCSLSGVAANSNQVLLRGRTTLGSDTAPAPRLPTRALRKGQAYQSSITPRGQIFGIVMRPFLEASGASARGHRSVLSKDGALAIIIQADRKNFEMVVLDN